MTASPPQPVGPPQSERAIANRGPLEGVVVLDFTTQKAGPMATYYLAALGATVVKIEEPKGDPVRGYAPFVTPDGQLALWSTDPQALSVPMSTRARGKYGVTLNLKKPQATAIYREMVKRADVVVENYSSGTADRLGIGYEASRAINPRIVYSSISGFGAGSMPGRKALDVAIQAASGIMMISGRENDDPVRIGMSIADVIASVYAVIGINAALYRRERTGKGEYVDISMLGATTAFTATEEWDALDRVGEPARTGNFNLKATPFGVFPCKDGNVAIAGGSRDAMAQSLFRIMGRPEWAEDPQYAVLASRCQRNDEVCAAVAQWCRHLNADEILTVLAEAGIPAEKVRTPTEAVREPLLHSRGEITTLEHPLLGSLQDLRTFGLPIRFHEAASGTGSTAPSLGEHNDLVYGEWLGFEPHLLREWKSLGVF